MAQETRLYNGDTKRARTMRTKENSNDYRYFPCPDLLPVVLSDEFLASVKAAMPELPEAKRARYQSELGLPAYDATLLSSDADTAHFFEALAQASGEPKLAANWVMGELSASLNRAELTIKQSPVSPAQLAGLIARIKDGTLSSKTAKQVFDILWQEGGDADAIIEAKGLKQVSDTGALAAIVDKVLADNPQQVANFRAAAPDKQPKMLGFFVGQAMKASQGKANPQTLNELLLSKLRGDA